MGPQTGRLHCATRAVKMWQQRREREERGGGSHLEATQAKRNMRQATTCLDTKTGSYKDTILSYKFKCTHKCKSYTHTVTHHDLHTWLDKCINCLDLAKKSASISIISPFIIHTCAHRHSKIFSARIFFLLKRHQFSAPPFLCSSLPPALPAPKTPCPGRQSKLSCGQAKTPLSEFLQTGTAGESEKWSQRRGTEKNRDGEIY